MTTISALSKTTLPLGPCPQTFAPLGSKLPSNFNLCCVGTSITNGTATTGLNSYRKNLWNMFQAAGLAPTFLGRSNTGSPGGSPWNLSEGVVGSTLPDHMTGGAVDTVSWIAGLSAGSRPSVLLHELGINDSSFAGLTSSFSSSMVTYIGQLEAIQAFRHVWSICPQRADATLNANLNTINAAIISNVASLRSGGTAIVTADSRMLQLVQGNPGAHYERIGAADLHPSDDGALFMSSMLFGGLLLASGRQISWVGDSNP